MCIDTIIIIIFFLYVYTYTTYYRFTTNTFDLDSTRDDLVPVVLYIYIIHIIYTTYTNNVRVRIRQIHCARGKRGKACVDE